MDKEKLKSDISCVLEEFSKLLIDHEENKQVQIKLKKLVDNFHEELNAARDAEHNADMKRSKSLEFVAQQQEVIVKLLQIKEENEQLKQTISHSEGRLVQIQMSRLSEQEKKDEEIYKIKQEYLGELLKIQEDGDLQVNKLKQDMDLEIQGLKSSIEVKKEKMVLQSNTISSLREEINSLKQKSVKDIEAYHNKLAEQEKVFQAELETWKVAMYSSDQNDDDPVRVSIPVKENSRTRPLQPMQNNSFSELHNGNAAYSSVSHKPEANSYYRYQQLQNDLTHCYSEYHDDCPRVKKNPSLPPRRDSTETVEDQYKLQRPVGPQTCHDGSRQQQSNNMNYSFSENNYHQTNRTSVNPQVSNRPVSQFQGISSAYKLPIQAQFQTYPKLPLISKNRQPKVVRPLPEPKESVKENAGFRKAIELYLQENVDKFDDNADKALTRNESDNTSNCDNDKKPKAVVPAKRRKLFNTELSTLL